MIRISDNGVKTTTHDRLTDRHNKGFLYCQYSGARPATLFKGLAKAPQRTVLGTTRLNCDSLLCNALLVKLRNFLGIKQRDRFCRREPLAHPLMECCTNSSSSVSWSRHWAAQIVPERLRIGVEPHDLRGSQARWKRHLILQIDVSSRIFEQSISVSPPRLHPISLSRIINGPACVVDEAVTHILSEHRPGRASLDIVVRTLTKVRPHRSKHVGEKVCISTWP